MRRRQFITLVGIAAATWPLAVRAQRSTTPVVGYLRSTLAAESAHIVKAFRAGLQEAGFIEGQNVAIEFRWADNDLDRLPALVEELQNSVVISPGIAGCPGSPPALRNRPAANKNIV